jgi:hypothetical protein
MNENKLYNQDVADIFNKLVKSNGIPLTFLTEGEIKKLSFVAKQLTANQPQAY